MLRWLRTLFARHRRTSTPSLATDATGILLTTGSTSRAIPWRSISRITAYKRDLYSHDEIIMVVEADVSGDPVISLSETFPGFADLFGPMEAELGLNPQWYLQVMTPAFEPSPTVLYIRDMDAADRADGAG